jgi:lipopolysaccharide transport system permease protein
VARIDPASGVDPARHHTAPNELTAPGRTIGRDLRAAARADWIVNQAPDSWLPPIDLRELWRFRELAFVLALRDLKVRYKQTAFGVAWVVIQPLAAVLIFSLVFGRVAHLASESVPYPVFVYSGLVLWTYFSGTLDSVAQSLVQNRDLVTKTFFPALIAPLALVLPGLVDLLVSLVVVGGVMAAYGVVPGAAVVLLPLWIVLCMLLVLGVGLWLAALNVQYRDVRHSLSFLLQIWLFASPVVYTSGLVDGRWRYVYALNPMVAVLDGFRWSLIGTAAPSGDALVSLAVGIAAFVVGFVYFVRSERRFADLI